MDAAPSFYNLYLFNLVANLAFAFNVELIPPLSEHGRPEYQRMITMTWISLIQIRRSFLTTILISPQKLQMKEFQVNASTCNENWIDFRYP